jgi:lysophospholipase L1-like esterase
MKICPAAAVLVLALFYGCASLTGKGETMLITPDEKTVEYSGRIDFSDAKAPRFDWPGVSLELNFENSSSCSVLLNDEGRNDFNIIVDGRQTGILTAKKGEKEYLLSEGLTLKKHTVLLTKRTEGYDGITVFKGFILDSAAKAVAGEKKKRIKMEFIGDSLTVGYGVEGKGIKCGSERTYKNNYLAFSAVAARELDADFNIVAISGRGVVRNYGEKTAISPEPLPLYYGRTLMNDPKAKWDFKTYTPDIVVVNLGTNDFSTEPKPEKNTFIRNYLKLIGRVRENYPKASIFICVGPTQSEPFFECVEKMKDGIRDKKVHWVNMRPLTEQDWGCDYHPNIKAAARMAGELVKQVKKVMVIIKE